MNGNSLKQVSSNWVITVTLLYTGYPWYPICLGSERDIDTWIARMLYHIYDIPLYIRISAYIYTIYIAKIEYQSY